MLATGNTNVITDPAAMRVRSFGGALVLAEVQGTLDGPVYDAIVTFAHAANIDPRKPVVMFVFDTPGGEWRHAAKAVAAVRQLAAATRTIAYVNQALGVGLPLAMSCKSVWAHPCARVGLLGVHIVDNAHLYGSGVEEALTAALMADVLTVRPAANSADVESLAERVFFGEQAEAMNLVDGLAASPEALLARLFNSER